MSTQVYNRQGDTRNSYRSSQICKSQGSNPTFDLVTKKFRVKKEKEKILDALEFVVQRFGCWYVR